MYNQRSEEVTALHGAGRYDFSTTYENLFVASSKWYSWSEERCKSHVFAFHSHTPSLPDTFKKPKTAGRTE